MVQVTTPPLAVAAAAAAAATAGGALFAVHRARSCANYQLILFLDSASGPSQRGQVLQQPVGAPLSDLITRVQANVKWAEGGAPPAYLYLYNTKQPLLVDTLEQQLWAASARNTKPVCILAAVGPQLSAAAIKLPPLSPPPHGPTPLPLLGNALCARGPWVPPMYNFYANLFTPDKVDKWGNTLLVTLPQGEEEFVALAGTFDDPAAITGTVMTCDPRVVAELTQRQEDFPKFWNRKFQRELQDFADNGVFTSSTWSEDWQTIHGILPRGFNQLRIQQVYLPIIVSKTRSFVAEWARFPEGHLVKGINEWLADMTSDAVVKAACGVDMHNIQRKGRGEPDHPLLAAWRELGSCRAQYQPPGLTKLVNNLRYGTGSGVGPPTWPSLRKRYEAAKAALADECEALVEATRRGDLGDTVWGTLIKDRSPSNGKYVRQRLLLGHFLNLLVAGHETTASTTGFLMYYLAHNPRWEQAIREEVRGVLNGRSELTAADVPKLVVTEACFREALRLHPAVAQNARDAAQDTTLLGKYLVRRGQRVLINLVALHRSEEQWGGKFGDPNTFNPERFLPGAAEAAGRHPDAFKPWGFGVRACVGMQFALWEAKVLVGMIYHHFTFQAPPDMQLKPSPRDSFPGISLEGLRLHIFPAPGAPAPPPALRTPSYTTTFTPPAASALAAAAAGGGGMGGGAAAVATPGAVTSNGNSSSSHGTPLLILYGSNSGTCEALAGQLADVAAAAGFAVTTATLDSRVGDLPQQGGLVVLSSTYNGFPPDNATKFAAWLVQQAAEGSTGAAGVQYTVFGVGNSQWATYQAFPKQLDAGLAAAGGTRMAPLGVTDVDSASFMDQYEEWTEALLPALLSTFKVAAPADGTAAAAASVAKRSVILTPAPAGAQPMTPAGAISRLQGAMPKIKAAAAAASKQLPSNLDFAYSVLKVTGAQQLQAPSSDRATRHVELQLPAGMTYSAGDHLEVLPHNPPHMVDAALQLLGLSGEEVFDWTPMGYGAARGFASHADGVDLKPIAMAARVVLSWLVDLCCIPGRRQVAALAASCPCPPEAAALAALSEEGPYKDKVVGQGLVLLDLLTTYRSLTSGLTLQSLVNQLPRLAPRYYSISSSPAAGASRATISVGLVQHRVRSGRLHLGPASSTIHDAQVGDFLLATVRKLSSSFHLPADPAVPLIMVGPGTGVAPMVGFLEEREALLKAGQALGPAVLFFGCRNAATDYIYQQRLEAWRASGVLTDLQVAFSRDGPSKVYVQDLVAAQAEALWDLLQRGAHVYVCGDARRMAPDVRRAFCSIAQRCGGKSEAAADAWMGALRDSGRYLEDVWAG